MSKTETRTIREAVNWARATLTEAGIATPAHDAERLLGHLLGVGRPGLLMRGAEQLTAATLKSFVDLVERRAKREPLQHILGHWPFLELELKVDQRALIPRPETEDLALLVRTLIEKASPGLIIDVGTGTGCLALAIGYSHANANLLAIDIDPQALELAEENARATGLDSRIRFLCGDLLGCLAADVKDVKAELIVANLPYVQESEYKRLEPEIQRYEPEHALVALEAGLGLIRRLIEQAANHLHAQGVLALELDPRQASTVRDQLVTNGWRDVEVRADRFERERFVIAHCPGPPSS